MHTAEMTAKIIQSSPKPIRPWTTFYKASEYVVGPMGWSNVMDRLFVPIQVVWCCKANLSFAIKNVAFEFSFMTSYVFATMNI